MTMAQVAGLLVTACARLPLAAKAIGYVAHLSATGLVESTRFVDLVPWVTMRLPPPSLIVLGGYYAAWVAWLACRRARVVRRVALACIFVTGGWVLAAPTVASTGRLAGVGDAWSVGDKGRWLRVTFLDVGQGDATLVSFPDRRTLLVDAGGTPGGGFDVGDRVVVPAVWALGVRRLDVLALSHGDPDHVGGVPAVLRDLRPREVWEGIPVPTHTPTQAIAAHARRLGARWRRLRAGDQRRFGSTRVRVWHPPSPDWERPRVRNDDSLILEIRLGGVSFLLPGDVGSAVEAGVIGQREQREMREMREMRGDRPRRLWVVKMPHHGSAGSSSAGFVDALRPAIAVASAGRGNRYGHPATLVVDRYARVGAAVFSTDREGAIQVETDGRHVRVRTMTGRTLEVTTALPRRPTAAGLLRRAASHPTP